MSQTKPILTSLLLFGAIALTSCKESTPMGVDTPDQATSDLSTALPVRPTAVAAAAVMSTIRLPAPEPPTAAPPPRPASPSPALVARRAAPYRPPPKAAPVTSWPMTSCGIAR